MQQVSHVRILVDFTNCLVDKQVETKQMSAFQRRNREL